MSTKDKNELNLLRLQNLRNESHYDTCDETFNLLLRWKKLSVISITVIILSIGFNIMVYLSYINITEEAAYNHKQDKYWKYFWRASAMAQSGNIDEMNKYLNRLANNDLHQCEERQKNVLLKAESLGNEIFEDGVSARNLLVQTPSGLEALRRMTQAQKTDPEGWNLFLHEREKDQHEESYGSN